MKKYFFLFLILAALSVFIFPRFFIGKNSQNIQTLDAAAQPDKRISFNGKIIADDPKTTYYFEYGGNPFYLKFQTPEQKLPLSRSAYLYESFDNPIPTLGSWFKVTHSYRDGAKNGFYRFSTPKNGVPGDENHVPVMGNITLPIFFFIGSFAIGDLKPLALSAGDSDLRDARIHLSLRGLGIHEDDFDMFFWLESQHNIELGLNGGWRRANWVLNSNSLTRYLSDGQWHNVTIDLPNNSNKWLYAGNNPEQGLVARRYAYRPLNDALEHLNVDFLFVLANIKKTFMGAIDIDEMLIEYRNESLIHPANGGRLILHPLSDDNPATLTDGWRFGDGKMWKSVLNPTSNQEFVFMTSPDSWVEKVQIHQNPQWPAKEIEILISHDGNNFKSVYVGEMPKPVIGNENVSYVIADFIEQAEFIKVIIKSGYQQQYWGLGEIEVFGQSSLSKVVIDDMYYVNQDIRNVVPGNKYYYRLVVKNSKGEFYGSQKTVVAK